MFKSFSTSLILRGLLAVTVGVLALAWPGVTVFALVVLFAVYALVASVLEATRAFRSRTAGPVVRHLLLGLVDLAAGLLALVWPLPTAQVLVLIVGLWAITSGSVEFLSSFRAGEATGARAMSVLGGLMVIVFGLVLVARPVMGAVTLAVLFGLFNLIYGFWMLMLGAELRHTGKTLHSIFRHPREA